MIQTDERDLDAIWADLSHSQILRRRALGVLALVAIAAALVVESAWPESGWMHQGLEWAGLVLLAVALLGRCACMLYLGGRKGANLVTDGPYSISRNPLYFFSILAVFGIGLQSGSIVLALAMAGGVYAIFQWIIGKEEELLRAAFGDDFVRYRADVPRLIPAFHGWHSPVHISVDLPGIWKTLRDAVPYFLAVPVFEVIEFAQQSGVVPVMVRLY